MRRGRRPGRRSDTIGRECVEFLGGGRRRMIRRRWTVGRRRRWRKRRFRLRRIWMVCERRMIWIVSSSSCPWDDAVCFERRLRDRAASGFRRGSNDAVVAWIPKIRHVALDGRTRQILRAVGDCLSARKARLEDMVDWRCMEMELVSRKWKLETQCERRSAMLMRRLRLCPQLSSRDDFFETWRR